MHKLIVIVGPTASGKTSLSIQLAKKFNGEIVSADSRQIYRGMDIGTAKPTKKEAGQIPHYLLDIKNPDEPYTVAEFKNDAVEIINKIIKNGKLPILIGGTGLYVKSIVDNLNIPKIEANPLLRQKIENQIKEKGIEYVFNELVKLDPEAAYVIDPKNPRRIVRALEVTIATKKPFTSQRKSGKPLFDSLELGISLPKEKLVERINMRIDKMAKNGLVKEVEELIKKYGKNQQAFDAIGYREIIKFLSGETTLDEALREMKINTRQYAKRQITWFKKDKKIRWIENQYEAEKLIEKFLK